MKKLVIVLALALLSVGAAGFAASWDSAADEQPQLRTLKGIVTVGDQPATDAVVYLKNTRSLSMKTYIAQKDGTYTFSSLSPNVDYEVYAEANGKRSDTKTLSSFDSRKVAVINLKIAQK